MKKDLSEKEEEIKYLESLIEIIKSQPSEDIEKCYIEISNYREGNKKFKHIIVKKREFIRDFNGNINRFKEVVLESLDFHDMKSTQNKIQEEIKWLKEKYNIN